MFVLFGPPRVVDGTVVGPAKEPCAKGSPEATPRYAVRLRHAIGEGDEIAIAVSCPGARVEYADGAFVMHTPGAKTPLRFARCASNEGLHLTAWRDNRRTWHEYWYLGMDLEPNCTEDEVQALEGD